MCYCSNLTVVAKGTWAFESFVIMPATDATPDKSAGNGNDEVGRLLINTKCYSSYCVVEDTEEVSHNHHGIRIVYTVNATSLLIHLFNLLTLI